MVDLNNILYSGESNQVSRLQKHKNSRPKFLKPQTFDYVIEENEEINSANVT